jgi:O-antigen ligase
MTFVHIPVCLFFLALPLSIAGMNVAAALLTVAALWLARNKEVRWDRSWNAVLLVLAAYAAAGLIAGLLGLNPGLSVKVVPKDLHKLWILAALLIVFSAKPPRRSLAWLIAGFMVLALVGIWQAATQRTYGGAWARAHGFVHAVTYGQQMAIGLLGALCFMLRGRGSQDSGVSRRMLAFFIIATSVALILSQTRAALLGLAAGFAAVCWLDKSLRRWLLWGGAVGLAVLFVWEMLPIRGGRSLLELFRHRELIVRGEVNPDLVRYVLWDTAVAMFRDHPWTGVGPDNYHFAFAQYFSGTMDGERNWGSAHNLYLHQLAERGLLGMAALGAVLFVLTARACRRARANPNAWNLWAWGSLIAFLVMNLTEVAFQNEQITTLVLTIWAWSEINKDVPAGNFPGA